MGCCRQAEGLSLDWAGRKDEGDFANVTDMTFIVESFPSKGYYKPIFKQML
jgi:hypothetical protein